ncbi:uncharacterized protein PRCAT00000939001 [Priceomyces carsonii]|uniref:uncharacterized protein n=1 Tax=Priceomyces carsonii TaxID=28549 RepID=UPI002EDAEF49|nr:unnamed protein product [Priceomyces carsonii]
MNNSGGNPALSDEEIADTIYRISKFKVSELKDLARSMELRLTGKKQEISDRIVYFFQQGRQANDNFRLISVRTLVLKKVNHDPLPPFLDLYNSVRTGAYAFTDIINQYSKSSVPKDVCVSGNESIAYKGHSVYFKQSPFYTIIRQVHGGPQAAFPAKGRSVCEYNFVLTPEENEFLRSKNNRIKFYLLCGVQSNKSPSSTEAPLQFPNPLELHVNGRLLKENVKGIKGRPGTAKPADITLYIKGNPRANKIQMVYTTSSETYLLYLFIVDSIPCKELVQKIMTKPHIHKESTISKIRNQSSLDEDDDIVVSTSSVTLRDPLSYTKMKYPTQSIYCTHTECFDGLTFLESQLQIPTWSCPHCQQAIKIEDLAISDYFLEILNSVPSDVDHVIVAEDGTWKVEENNSDTRSQTPDTHIKTEKHISKEPSVIPEGVEVVSIDSESDDDSPSATADANNSSSRINSQKEYSNSANYSIPAILRDIAHSLGPPVHVSGNENQWNPNGNIINGMSPNEYPHGSLSSLSMPPTFNLPLPILNQQLPIMSSLFSIPPRASSSQQYGSYVGRGPIIQERNQNENEDTDSMDTEDEIPISQGHKIRSSTSRIPVVESTPDSQSSASDLHHQPKESFAIGVNSGFGTKFLPNIESQGQLLDLSQKNNSSMTTSDLPSMMEPTAAVNEHRSGSSVTSVYNSEVSPGNHAQNPENNNNGTNEKNNRPTYSSPNNVYPEGMKDRLAYQDSHRIQQREQYEKHLQMKNQFQQSLLRRTRNQDNHDDPQSLDRTIPHAETSFRNNLNELIDIPFQSSNDGNLESPYPSSILQRSKSQNEIATASVTSNEQEEHQQAHPGMRYSKLAFDLLSEARRVSDSSSAPALKKQKLVEDLNGNNRVSALNLPQAQSVSPLNSKIGTMALVTPRPNRRMQKNSEETT